MYQNRHGRFTAPDPLLASASLSNPQTFNRYVYVGNNPVNLTDPSGLSWCNQIGTTNYRYFGGVGSPCPGGWTNTDDNTITVTSDIFTSRDGSQRANRNDVITLNADGTLEIVTVAQQAQIAQETGTEIQAESDPIEASPATIGDHITSAFMTAMENNGGNAYYAITGTQPYNEHTELGQNIGNVASLAESAFLIGNGLATTGVGGLLTIVTAPACLTGVGCAIPAGTLTITAAGLAQIAGGSAVLGNTIYNMSSNQGAASRSGYTPNNTPQGASSAYNPNATTGGSVPNTRTDVGSGAAAKTLKENGYKMTKSKSGKAYTFSKNGVKKYGYNPREGGRPTLEKYEPGKKQPVRKIRLSSPKSLL